MRQAALDYLEAVHRLRPTSLETLLPPLGLQHPKLAPRIHLALLECGSEVLQRLYAEHSASTKVKSIAALAARDEKREDQALWTYCLGILFNYLSGTCPSAIARAWLLIAPRVRALQPEVAPRELLVESEANMGTADKEVLIVIRFLLIYIFLVSYLLEKLYSIWMCYCHNASYITCCSVDEEGCACIECPS